MNNLVLRRVIRAQWLVISILFAPQGTADECPGAGTSLTNVRYAISDFQKNGRAPAGADCAYEWAINYDLPSSKLDLEVLDFFRAAADVQRRAAEKRYEAKYTTDGDKYLDQEITLHQRFLREALGRDVGGKDADQQRSYVVQHLSYLVSALAMRRQYDKVAEDLGDRDPAVIDNEALKVWLQAVWSCARWDGNKNNLCSDTNPQKCRDKIEVFLQSVEGMKNRTFPPQTKRDIADLKRLASNGGCLK